MRFCVLGSGSKGNCSLIESNNSRILIDCGFSAKETIRRLAGIGCDPQTLSAIIVTHEHSDHVSGVGVLSRKLKIPVYINAPTYTAVSKKLGKLTELQDFSTGEAFSIKDLQIHPFSVSHDTADPVGFTLSDGKERVGYCTDTGRVTRLIRHHLNACKALILEANHDPTMLKNGPYPLPLQQRIQSATGHLSNRDAVLFAAELAENGLQQLVLAHLSETNNHPDIVLSEVKKYLCSTSLHVALAKQDEPTGFIDIDGY